MDRPSPFRLIAAIVVIVVGAAVAGQVTGTIERSFIGLVAGMIAVFVMIDRGGGQSSPRASRIADQPARITHHPHFQQFVDGSFDPVLIVENNRVTNANAAALQLIGGQVIGDDVRTAIRHAGAIERITDENAVHSGQPIRVTGIGLRDQAWDIRIGVIGDGRKLIHLTDRTETQASERMRVDFVANASHELLTPLASVKGFIETLGEPDAGDDVALRTRFLKIMADETDRMQLLIRDLMSLSRIESEKYQPVSSAVDVGELVTDAIAALREGSIERGQDIILDCAAHLPPVLGDAGLLLQLVNNIVANAMKYGRNGTPIAIVLGASRSGNMVRLSVTDQGDGIAPDHIPRLTERFYRVDSGRSRALGGTGLGLSLVKHIVDRHRGHLEIASEVGRGTTVSVLLPVLPAGQIAPPSVFAGT